MNVLQIVPEMKMGGVETGTLDLSRALVLAGHQAWVISAGGPLVQELEKSGVRHVLLPVEQKNPLQIWSLAKKVRRIILSEKIDIVHARSRVPAWIAFLAVRKTPARFLTTAHGYYRPHWGSQVMGWGERVICVSKAVQEHIQKRFHAAPDRTCLIHRGVDLSKFPFRDRIFSASQLRIGLVGRITPLKGHDDFIRAIGLLREEIPFVKGIVIGDAPGSKKEYYDSLLNLRDQLGLKETIEFQPGISNIAEAMQKLDLLVLATTVPEAFGRVIVEAQALGIPVIATSVGGVVDIIDDAKTGWLVPCADPRRMAEKIKEVFSLGGKITEIVKNARKKAEESFNLQGMVKKTLNVYQSLLKEPKILIIKFSALGDLILISPALRAFKQFFPGGQVALLTNDVYQTLAQNSPYVDSVLTRDTQPGNGFVKWLKLLWEIRCRRFDVLVDFQNNDKSHWLGWASGIRRRIGYARGGRGFCLTQKIEYLPENGPVESQNRLLNLLGISIQDKNLEMWSSPSEIKKVNDWFESKPHLANQPLIALFPFSNARWQTKRWGDENFIELARRIDIELDAIAVFVGGKEDVDFVRQLSSLDFRHESVVGLFSLGELHEFLKKCRAFVTGDSAPLHVAAAAGVPTLALFGPTDPRRHCPPGQIQVLHHPVSCAPCYLTVCKITTHDCLKKISVDQVLDEIRKILVKNKSTS
jgi:ADP-heptose:LPS heptosyltransferase/glycosyltransferase involved in cell wall biosynthesis